MPHPILGMIIPSTYGSFHKHTQPCLLVVCEEGGDVVLVDLEPFILCMGLQIILNHRVVKLRHLVHRHHGEAVEQANYCILVGFWPRVRARALRAPVFLGSLPRPTGAACPPAHRSFAVPPKTNKKLFPVTKCFPSGPNSGCQGRIFFSTGLSRTLLSYIASY